MVIFDDLQLGIIRYKNNYHTGDNIVNHRSLFKIIFNPILRIFGYHFVSMMGAESLDGKLNGKYRYTITTYELRKTTKTDYIIWSWYYKLDPNCYIDKKRMIF